MTNELNYTKNNRGSRKPYRVGKPNQNYNIMKNFKFLLVAAVVFAAGSAFTTQKTQDLYILTSNGYLPIDQAGPGHCENGGSGCEFEKIGSEFYPLDRAVWVTP